MTLERPMGGDAEMRHMAAIVASSDDAIISKDRNAIVTSWNPGAERLYGWRADEVIGGPISILIPEHRAGEERRVLDKILLGERLEHYETERKRRDGSLVWVSLTISPVRDETGEIIAAAVISHDITERREAQQERERLLAEAERARNAAERSRGRLSLLDAASELLSSTFDLHGSLDDLADLITTRFGATCTVRLVDDVASRAIENPGVAGGDDGFQWLRDKALASGHVETAADAPPDGAPGGHELSAIVAPIPARSGSVGVVTALTKPGTLHDEDDIALLREIARRAGLAIENARAFETEHALALTLQRSLLPHDTPKVVGVSVAARYLPAAANLNVGGDWYDVIAASDGAVFAAIGDVAGHGLAAAATMGQLRNILRAYAFDGEDGSAPLLDRLNRFVDSTEGLGMATLELVHISAEADELTIARAGHPSPILRSADGSVRVLTGPSGPPIGAGWTRPYAETTCAFAPGDSLILFTDGLVERRGEALDVGIARLQEAIKSGPQDIEELCDFVIAQLADAHDERRDDIALLILGARVEDPGSFEFSEPARPVALAVLRKGLRRWLEAAGVAPGRIHAIVTAANEAASNVVEHAYPREDGMLFASGRTLATGAVEVTVRDHGAWRAHRDTGGGRGRRIITSLATQAAFDSTPEGTVVTMLHNVGGKADV